MVSVVAQKLKEKRNHEGGDKIKIIFLTNTKQSAFSSHCYFWFCRPLEWGENLDEGISPSLSQERNRGKMEKNGIQNWLGQIDTKMPIKNINSVSNEQATSIRIKFFSRSGLPRGARWRSCRLDKIFLTFLVASQRVDPILNVLSIFKDKDGQISKADFLSHAKVRKSFQVWLSNYKEIIPPQKTNMLGQQKLEDNETDEDFDEKVVWANILLLVISF